MYPSVIAVKPLDNYRLKITFENDEVKCFDVNPYLEIGIFKKLKNKDFFRSVKVSFDSVEWDGGIDIDPEELYEQSTYLEKLQRK
ncbi:hypothetical protein AGMMS49938_04950 [Fibrobacterales bacterium]|nr:hypothetical protein AGMMS49938_04950 [Fibrobacterales bacterium]